MPAEDRRCQAIRLLPGQTCRLHMLVSAGKHRVQFPKPTHTLNRGRRRIDAVGTHRSPEPASGGSRRSQPRSGCRTTRMPPQPCASSTEAWGAGQCNHALMQSIADDQLDACVPTPGETLAQHSKGACLVLAPEHGCQAGAAHAEGRARQHRERHAVLGAGVAAQHHGHQRDQVAQQHHQHPLPPAHAYAPAQSAMVHIKRGLIW